MVGYLWFTIAEQYDHSFAFVSDIEIRPEFRRKGYGREALKALEQFASDLGVTSIRLHVFAFNKEAQALYAELGFNPVGTQLEKSLEGAMQ